MKDLCRLKARMFTKEIFMQLLLYTECGESLLIWFLENVAKKIRKYTTKLIFNNRYQSPKYTNTL